MNQKELEKTLEANKLEIADFYKWMDGQTVGLDDKGETDWYDCDVERFIRGRGKLSTLD
jgi:NOL1/NOP2/fmu family ribosome biogenesis protein